MKERMKIFLRNHKNQTFSATGLARSLGWEQTRKWKDSDGHEHTKTSLNTKAAVRLSKKCGATVERGPRNERWYKITWR